MHHFAIKRALALCLSLCFAITPPITGIAAACEGGGEIQTTPGLLATIKFEGKVAHPIKVKNIGSAPVKILGEEVTEPAFAFVHKCENTTTKKLVTELAVGEVCESSVEHTSTTKGQNGTWDLKWNGGGVNEVSKILLESV